MSGPVHAPRPRARARRIALIVWVVVFLLVAIPTMWSIVSYSGQPEDQRVPAAGGDVTISEPGEYAVYAETTSSSPGNYGGLASVTAPSGAAVVVEPPRLSENYNYDNRVATRIGTFTASEPGVYEVIGNAEGAAPGDELVVSTRTVGSLLGIVFGAIATGIVLVAGLVAGLVLFLVGRRRPPPPPPGAWPGGSTPQWQGQPGPYGPYGPPAGQYGPYGPPPGHAPAGPTWSAPAGSPPAGGSPYGNAPSGGGPGGVTPYRAPEDPTTTVRPTEPPAGPGGGSRA